MRGAGAWAIRLALSRGSPSLRSEAAELLRRLAADSTRARFAALGALVRAFETLEARDGQSLAFFDLLESLLAMRDEAAAAPEGGFERERDDDALAAFCAPRAENRSTPRRDDDGVDPVAARFLGARGFVRRALERIARETASPSVGGPRRRDRRAGSGGGRDVGASGGPHRRRLDAASRQTSGSVCLDAVDTGAEFGSFAFGAEPSGGGFEDHLPDDPRSFKTRDARFAEALLSAFPRDAKTNAARLALDASLAAASLVRARTPETAVAAASLASLVDRVAFSGGEHGLAAVVDAAVRALRRVAGLDTEPTVTDALLTVPAGAALTALARFALPAEPEDDAPASFPLRLSKAPTQEEFIRGRMTKNPYDSLTIRAETMRDVKNFVCASLDMHGLCDDDYGMELLVAGRIVSLDLTVREAYDGVWRQTSGGGAAESGPGRAREPGRDVPADRSGRRRDGGDRLLRRAR